jgi:hypothetical protein
MSASVFSVRRCSFLVAVTLLAGSAGCTKDDVADPANLLDTGWFDTATLPDPDECTDLLVSSEPEAGDVGWYWRDRPTLFVGTADPAAYTAWLEKASGERIATELEWDESGVVATLVWEGWLEANTDYVLGVQDCSGIREMAFRTSEFGRPLESGPETLEDRTYLLDLVAAEWTEPAILAGVMRTYFTTPVLLGVRYVDATRIDFLGAPGITDQLGNVSQDLLSPTWDFPLTDFTTAPYLETQVDLITLQYRNGNTLVDIPVEDFVLKITFAADGTRAGGGVLSGLADSRYLGALLDSDEPDALCVIAAGVGVQCVPCSDGMPYCLKLVGEEIEGDVVPGLTLFEIAG